MLLTKCVKVLQKWRMMREWVELHVDRGNCWYLYLALKDLGKRANRLKAASV